MLKTNSSQARQNLRAYIIERFDGESYGIETPETFDELAAILLDTFRSEKYHTANDRRYYHDNEQAAFADWAAGLPSILDTCYYYNRPAVDDLGAILEETDSEKARYSETQAENLLTSLIYRELIRRCK